MDTIDNILLVGGSSCIPLVKKMLSAKYGNDKVLSSEKPMLAIAEGAAILAQSLPTTDEPVVTHDQADQPVGVVLTTKHQVFIQLEDPTGSHRMEKIIDSQEVLPLEVNRKFRTVNENQKIVEIRLFSDVENGGYKKTASGFFTISDNLPAMSDLNFSFNLDEDETMTAKVKIVSSGKVISIRLGRGQNDSRCLSELSQKIEEVLSNPQIADSKKATFIEDIQRVIDSINKDNYSPDDSRWSEYDNEIGAAYTRALLGDKQENNLGEILASILLGQFSKYLNSSDETQMREKLFALKNSNDSFEKASLSQELETLSSRYSLLTHIFLFKLVGDNSTDPQVAGRAVCVYDEMIAALDSHNIPEVNELIGANEDLLDEIKTGTISIGMGTGIG